MYYEEKLIDGVWYHRGTPKGEWILGRLPNSAPPKEKSLVVEALQSARMRLDVDGIIGALVGDDSEISKDNVEFVTAQADKIDKAIRIAERDDRLRPLYEELKNFVSLYRNKFGEVSGPELDSIFRAIDEATHDPTNR